MNLFSEEMRRNPYPAYAQMREASPLLHDAESGLWMIFDYDGVKRALNDQEAFSSRHGPAEWLVFLDPPRHSKLRTLISQAFTPRAVASLEQRIGKLSRELLDENIESGEMDLAADYAVQLPMLVIAEMLGIPVSDRSQFKRWNDVMVKMSYTVTAGKSGGEETARVMKEFIAVTVEMNEYLTDLLAQRQAAPKDDLLTRLIQAEVEGARLTQEEILGFFQLLLLAGSETTANLINNAVLCFIENPDQLSRLRATPDLLPSAIEEVLRYRSPLQWMFRLTKRDVAVHGQTIPAGKLALAMIGSANRDPKQFHDANRFDITRDPNPHVAFGFGIHFCLGAALARLESKIALADLFERLNDLQLASNQPWEPRNGTHVHGPSRLPVRFKPGKRSAS